MNTKTFYRKWNNKYLEDACSQVSKEYRGFQTSLTNLIKSFADENGAVVVNVSKGHYWESYMIEKGGKYCYIYRSGIRQRTVPQLGNPDSFLIRTAEHAEDWRGGSNCYCSIWDLSTMIGKKLEEKHIRF